MTRKTCVEMNMKVMGISSEKRDLNLFLMRWNFDRKSEGSVRIWKGM